MTKYNINKMIIDGFSKEQIANEIAKAEKINISKIYQDGYSTDDILKSLDDKYKPNNLQEVENLQNELLSRNKIVNQEPIIQSLNKNVDVIKNELKNAGDKWSVFNLLPEQYNPDNVNKAVERIYKTYKNAEKQGLNLNELVSPEVKSIIDNYGDWTAFNISKPILSTDSSHIEKISDIVERKPIKQKLPQEIKNKFQGTIDIYNKSIQDIEQQKNDINKRPETTIYKITENNQEKQIGKNELLDILNKRQKDLQNENAKLNNDLNKYISSVQKDLENPTADVIKKQYAILASYKDKTEKELKELPELEKLDAVVAQDFLKSLTKEDREVAGIKETDVVELFKKNWKDYLLDVASINPYGLAANVAYKTLGAISDKVKIEGAFNRQANPELYNEIKKENNFWNFINRNVNFFKEKNQEIPENIKKQWYDEGKNQGVIKENYNIWQSKLETSDLFVKDLSNIKQEDEKLIDNIIDEQIKGFLEVGETSAATMADGIINVIPYAVGMGIAKKLGGNWLEKKITQRLTAAGQFVLGEGEKGLIKNIINKAGKLGTKLISTAPTAFIATGLRPDLILNELNQSNLEQGLKFKKDENGQLKPVLELTDKNKFDNLVKSTINNFLDNYGEQFGEALSFINKGKSITGSILKKFSPESRKFFNFLLNDVEARKFLNRYGIQGFFTEVGEEATTRFLKSQITDPKAKEAWKKGEYGKYLLNSVYNAAFPGWEVMQIEGAVLAAPQLFGLAKTRYGMSKFSNRIDTINDIDLLKSWRSKYIQSENAEELQEPIEILEKKLNKLGITNEELKEEDNVYAELKKLADTEAKARKEQLKAEQEAKTKAETEIPAEFNQSKQFQQQAESMFADYESEKELETETLQGEDQILIDYTDKELEAEQKVSDLLEEKKYNEQEANEKLLQLVEKKKTQNIDAKEKFDFLESLPEGAIIQSDEDSRTIIPKKLVTKKGTIIYELIPQIKNEDTGEWEDNPSAVKVIEKKIDGTYSGDFTTDFDIFSYTDIKTDERKIQNPKIIFPKTIKSETEVKPTSEIQQGQPDTQMPAESQLSNEDITAIQTEITNFDNQIRYFETELRAEQISDEPDQENIAILTENINNLKTDRDNLNTLLNNTIQTQQAAQISKETGEGIQTMSEEQKAEISNDLKYDIEIAENDLKELTKQRNRILKNIKLSAEERKNQLKSIDAHINTKKSELDNLKNKLDSGDFEGLQDEGLGEGGIPKPKTPPVSPAGTGIKPEIPAEEQTKETKENLKQEQPKKEVSLQNEKQSETDKERIFQEYGGTPEKELSGKKTTIQTQTRDVKAKYKIVPLSFLIQSHYPITFNKNEEYPANVQERQYDLDKSEQKKVIDYINKFNYKNLLTDSVDATTGAPMITSKGIVLGANGRTMILKGVLEKYPEKFVEYKNQLKKLLDFYEIENKEEFDNIENPVLVREIDEEITLKKAQELVRILQKGLTQELSPIAEAVSKSKMMNLSINNFINNIDNYNSLADFLSNQGSRDFIKALLKDGIITEQEVNKYVNQETQLLNEEGKKLVEKILLGTIINNADLIDYIYNTHKTILNKIIKSIPEIIQLKKYSEYDLTTLLNKSIKRIIDYDNSGYKKYGEFLNQPFLFEEYNNENRQADILAMSLLEFNQTTLKEAFKEFLIYAQGTEFEDGFDFVKKDILNPIEAFDKSFSNKLKKENGNLLFQFLDNKYIDKFGDLNFNDILLGSNGREYQIVSEPNDKGFMLKDVKTNKYFTLDLDKSAVEEDLFTGEKRYSFIEKKGKQNNFIFGQPKAEQLGLGLEEEGMLFQLKTKESKEDEKRKDGKQINDSMVRQRDDENGDNSQLRQQWEFNSGKQAIDRKLQIGGKKSKNGIIFDSKRANNKEFKDLIAKYEKLGFVILPVIDDTQSFSGVTLKINGKPYIFLSQFNSSEYTTEQTIEHEIGHYADKTQIINLIDEKHPDFIEYRKQLSEIAGEEYSINQTKEELAADYFANVKIHFGVTIQNVFTNAQEATKIKDKLRSDMLSTPTNIEADLMREAKKYDNVDEFINSFNLYHGTPEDIENNMLKFGAGKQLKKGGYMGGHFLTNKLAIAKEFSFGGKIYRSKIDIKKDIFDVNKNKRMFKNFIGKEYIDQDGDKVIFTKNHYDFMFPDNEDADWSTVYADLANKFAKERGQIGFSINEYAAGTEGITYQIFKDEIPIYTESQLTDIWNRAQAQKADTTPLNEAELIKMMSADFNVSQEQLQKEFDAVKAKYENTDKWLKAPNGKNTNLSEHLWVMVRTPRFKNWFGDWENDAENASKVVDENGEPLVVFHGSGTEFYKFDKKIAQDKEGREWGVGTGSGVFSFTSDINSAYNWMNRSKERGKYGIKSDKPTLMSVFLNIKNPITRDDFSNRLEEKFKDYSFKIQKIRDKFIKEIYNELKKEKKDGIISDFDEITVFNPNQIKSIDNTGAFSAETGDIRYMIDENGNRIEVKSLPEGLEIVNSFYSNIEKKILETKNDSLKAEQWIEKFGRNNDETNYTGMLDFLESKGLKNQIKKSQVLDFIKNNRIEIVEVVKDNKYFVINSIGNREEFISYKDAKEFINQELDWIENDSITINENGSGEDIDIVDSDNELLTRYVYDSENDNYYEENNSDIYFDDFEEALSSAEDYATEQKEYFEKNLSNKPEIIQNEETTQFSQYQLDNEGENYREVLIVAPKIKAEFEVPEAHQYGEYESDFKRLAHLRMSEREDKNGNKVLFLEEVQSDFGQAFRDKKTEAKAPFITKTTDWVKLALKYAMIEAVKVDADYIAWTTGEQQAERYDLSKQIDVLDFKKNNDGTTSLIAYKNNEAIIDKLRMDNKTLSETVGKEIAKKVIESKENRIKLEGQDLKVGGEGMLAFYGNPKTDNKGIIGAVIESKDLFDKESIGQIDVGYGKQHAVKITDEIKQKVKQGLPQFMLNRVNNAIKFMFDKIGEFIPQFKNLKVTSDPKFQFIIPDNGKGNEYNSNYIKKYYGENVRKYMTITNKDDLLSLFTDSENFVKYALENIPVKSHLLELLKRYPLGVVEDFYNKTYAKKDKNEKVEIAPEDPFNLLKEQGYTLSKQIKNLENAKDLFLAYYQGEGSDNQIAGSIICTLGSETRFKENVVMWVVKDNAENIPRATVLTEKNMTPEWEKYLTKKGRRNEDGTFNLKGLYPEREDPFGTSVLSIQLAKGGKSHKIINRYNHDLQKLGDKKNPDRTFDEDLDKLANNLENSLYSYYNLPRPIKTKKENLPANVIRDNKNNLYVYRKEENGVYYGDGFYIKNGIATILNPNTERMVDGFIFNEKGEIKKIIIENSDFIFDKEDIKKIKFTSKKNIKIITELGDVEFPVENGISQFNIYIDKKLSLKYLNKFGNKAELDNNNNILITEFNNNKNINLLLPENTTFENQGSVDLRNLQTLPENTTFENQGYVNLRNLQTLPENTTFENQGSVDLDNLQTLPENTTFENQGSVYLDNLQTLPENTTFENQGSVFLNNLQTLPENTTFENQGSVDLSNLQTLPENTTFKNQGSVDLSNLQTLPENTTFENQGYVNLRNLQTLPENTTFENQGSVFLDNLQTLPENTTFENQGSVFLDNLQTLPENTTIGNNILMIYLKNENIGGEKLQKLKNKSEIQFMFSSQNSIENSAKNVIDAISEKVVDQKKVKVKVNELVANIISSGITKIKDIFNKALSFFKGEILNNFPNLRKYIGQALESFKTAIKNGNIGLTVRIVNDDYIKQLTGKSQRDIILSKQQLKDKLRLTNNYFTNIKIELEKVINKIIPFTEYQKREEKLSNDFDAALLNILNSVEPKKIVVAKPPEFEIEPQQQEIIEPETKTEPKPEKEVKPEPEEVKPEPKKVYPAQKTFKRLDIDKKNKVLSFGLGVEKKSRLRERMLNDLSSEYQESTFYNVTNMEVDRDMAFDFVDNNYNLAKLIVLGIEENNTGILTNNIAIALQNFEKALGNMQSASNIITETSLNSTYYGKEISALRGTADMTSEFYWFKQLLNDTKSKVLEENGIKIDSVAKTQSKEDVWQKFINFKYEQSNKSVQEDLNKQINLDEFFESIKC